MGKTKKKVEVLTQGHECLSVVSSDGKGYRRHLQVELRVHRYLMGALREEDDVWMAVGECEEDEEEEEEGKAEAEEKKEKVVEKKKVKAVTKTKSVPFAFAKQYKCECPKCGPVRLE